VNACRCGRGAVFVLSPAIGWCCFLCAIEAWQQADAERRMTAWEKAKQERKEAYGPLKLGRHDLGYEELKDAYLRRTG
jgi:hypothetical protein